MDARAMRRGREAGKNRRLSDDFSERVKMAASDAAAGDKFGYSVAIDGDTVVIGAYNAGTGGAVYVTSERRRRAGQADCKRCCGGRLVRHLRGD